MIEVSTEHHLSSSDNDEKPVYKCQGSCKKVWWRQDIEQAPIGVILHCPMCGGSLSAAREGMDYRIVRSEPGTKVFPGNPATVKHASNILVEFIPLREKHGWR